MTPHPKAMRHQNPPEPQAGAAPEARLHAAIEHAAHILPAQGPIGVFVHHNTLHAFQHLPFHEAVAAASAAYGAEGYLSEAEYHAHFASGRITDEDLEAALAEHLAGRAEERRGPLSRHDIERIALRSPILPETAAGLRWRTAERAETRGSPEIQALWEACRAAPLPPAPPTEPPIHDRVGVDRTHRDLLLALTGEDPAELVDPILIRLLSAYLDDGVAHWAMPERERGLWHAFASLVAESPPAAPFLHELPDELRRLGGGDSSPAAVTIRILGELGVAEERWEAYLTRVALELPGWAGMVSRLEHNPSDRAPGAPPASLLSYLAIRLCLARFALRDVAQRRLGFEGPLAGLAEHAWRVAPPPAPPERSPDHDRPYRLFQLARAAGLSASDVQATSVADRVWALSVLEGFDEVARRRVWQEAYERHHRVEVMGAIAANLRRPLAERQVADPRFQLITCIDDRECGLRRSFEELSPRHETLSAAGFFGLPIRYRGLDDAGHASLCPVGVEPAHEVVERPHEEEVAGRRAARRRWWARTLHALTHGTRTMARGVALTPTLGLLYVLPLVGRVLMPRATARIHDALARRFLPAPATRLESPGEEGAALALTAAQKATRLRAMLENMGLVRVFAPIVVVLGHGSRSSNNPHQSAYDCGACGGRQGGPNARLFAAMANDPEARAKLREMGIHIPDGTWFVGGLHNTTTDGITLFDEHLAPEALRSELGALREALDEARRRHAHERCRRFESAPRGTDPDRALAHVEERAEDLSQARPELGHVTNSSCIVGRRTLTRGLFLDRRSLLISYDPTLDAEGMILERILAAAGPVGAGINLEYYFSRVDNRRYGCGTKLPHNLVSLLGVMEGAQGDLRTGLPQQMVEIHEPVRLLVVVEATPRTAAGLCERQPVLRELIHNGWIQLVCVDPETGEMTRFVAGGFEPLAVPESSLPQVERSADWYAGKRDFVPPAIIRGRRSEEAAHAA